MQPPATIVDFEDAQTIVLSHAAGLPQPVATETVPLLQARGRVLAEAVVADRDHPPFDRSTRDGFAVRAKAFATGQPLQIAGVVRAGERWAGDDIGELEAVQIMTGAPIPSGADAVAMIEHVAVGSATMQAGAGRTLQPGESIVPRGSEARQGQLVLTAGVRVGAAEIALAAACGCASLKVFRRPRIAIVATGDELVELDQVPDAQQIRNSNSYAIAAMVEAAGGEAVRLAIVPDERKAVAAAIREARQCDLIVLSGGVSMGEYDLVEEMLLAEGAEFFFTGVRMQPGKPVVFGQLAALGSNAPCYFFGLPGNPVSTQVTFHAFAETLVRAMCGAGASGPAFVLASLAEEVAGKPGLTRLLPARMDGTQVKLVGWQGSGDLAANARANCYAELRPGVSYRIGELVRVLLR